MRVNLHSDLIEVSLVADQRTNGKTHSTSMVYRPPSEPQVLIARFLILVKEKNTMSDKKRKAGERAINITTILMGILALILWLLGYGRD